jgi:signal transduction histidine kinase
LDVIADPQALRQVTDNLISNAIKFSPAKTQREIGFKKGKEMMGLYVKDQGPGIPKKELPKLFMKFQKLSNQPTGGEKSTGLGLALVKKYMDAMEGQILCESEKGKGTTFTIFLPTASATSA